MPGGSAAREDAPPRGTMIIAWRRAWHSLARLVDQGMDFSVHAFSLGMKILGPLLICLALSLKGFVTYVFFMHALPEMDWLGLPGRSGVSFLGLFLLSNTLYNYARSILTDPGQPPEFEEARAELELRAKELGEPGPRQCGRCTKLKPPRCHHCSICRRCVLKMDHHCPWINNCVGYRNYRFFCLFLLFLAASCLFIITVFSQTFAEIVHFKLERRRGSRSTRQSILTSFMVCCSILVAICLLGGFHVYLVLSNQTTIEFQTNVRWREARKSAGEFCRNPYNLGRTRNFQQVFGPSPVCRFRWLLSWLAPAPTGDGMNFPSIARLGA